MADETIVIEIQDRIPDSIGNKLKSFASDSTKAATAVDRLNAAENKAAIGASRLAQADANAANAQQRLAASADRAAIAHLKLEQAQKKQASAAERSQASVGKTTNGFNQLFSSLRSGLIAAGVVVSIHQIAELGDAYLGLKNKLSVVADSEEQLATLTQRVADVANNTRTPVEETAMAFARFDRAMINLGASQEETLRLTETVNKAMVVSGAKAGEQAAGLLQLSQAFNKGKLDGDEFRTVMELMPSIADAIAKKMKVTRGELLKLAPEGKITAKIMREAFSDAAIEIDAKFAKTMPTIGQAVNVLKNDLILMFGEIEKGTGVVGGTAAVVQSLGNSIKSLTPDIVIVVSAVGDLVTNMFALKGVFGDSIGPMDVVRTVLRSIALAIAIISDGIRLLIGDVALFISLLTNIPGMANPLYDFAQKMLNAESSVGKWNKQIKEADIALEKFNTQQSKLKTVQEQIDNVSNAFTDLQNKMQVLEKTKNKSSAVKNALAEAKKDLDTLRTTHKELTALKGKLQGVGIRDASLGETPAKTLDKKAAKEAESRASALAKINAQLNAEREALQMLEPERTIHERMSQIEIGFNQKHKEGLGKLKDGILEKIKANELEKQVMQQVDSLYSGSLNKSLEDYNNKIKASQILLDRKLISEQEAANAVLRANEAYAKANDPMFEYNRNLREQQELLKSVGTEQEVDNQVQQLANQLRNQGVSGYKQLAEMQRGNIANSIEENRVQQAKNQIYSETVGEEERLTAQMQALTWAQSQGLISLETYNAKLMQLNVSYAKLRLEAGKGNFTDLMNVSIGSIVNGYTNMLDGLSNAFGDFYNSMADGIANSIGQAIVHAQTLKEGLLDVARSITSGLISALVKLGIQWVVNAALGQSLAASSSAAAIATNATTAAALATAYATPAALASLASFGANSGPAMVGMAATEVFAEGMAAISGMGFASGGYTGDGAMGAVAGVVHGKEYVVNAAATARNRSTLEAMNAGKSVGNASQAPVINIQNFGTSKSFETQQLDENTIRIIARDEADKSVTKNVPRIVSSDMNNPNSSIAKSVRRNTTANVRRV